jgi:hypothetical protein
MQCLLGRVRINGAQAWHIVSKLMLSCLEVRRGRCESDAIWRHEASHVFAVAARGFPSAEAFPKQPSTSPRVPTASAAGLPLAAAPSPCLQPSLDFKEPEWQAMHVATLRVITGIIHEVCTPHLLLHVPPILPFGSMSDKQMIPESLIGAFI